MCLRRIFLKTFAIACLLMLILVVGVSFIEWKIYIPFETDSSRTLFVLLLAPAAILATN